MNKLDPVSKVIVAVIALLVLGYAAFDLTRMLYRVTKDNAALECELHAQIFNADGWGFAKRRCYLEVDGKWYWFIGGKLRPIQRDPKK